ncbi:hypothetical protein [Lacipirellula sp.]|uniref:hypothetical protein n=1 Tax=Lacipirellula sp. TaxID=2691419 RepID=UPI003D0F9A19
MQKYDRLEVVVAVVAFAVFLFTPLNPADDQLLLVLLDDPRLAWFVGLATIIGTPLSFALPSLRVSFMGRYWKVPSTAYVFHRWVLRLCCGMMAGQVAATFTLAITRDERMLWLLPFQLVVGGAFCLGTWRRLKTPASNEFTMPWWPWLR